MKYVSLLLTVLLCAGVAMSAGNSDSAAKGLKVNLPLARTFYQTNEWIDLAVVRTAGALQAGPLTLSLAGDDGSKVDFAFQVPAGEGSRTEHLHIDGRLLRPGHYKMTTTCDGKSVDTEFDVMSHIRKSDFRLVSWGRAAKEQRFWQGEDGFGFNLIYGQSTGDTDDASYMRAGVDSVGCCVMSGAHQMDLRLECDWSDPYVTRGGTARVVRRTLFDRTRGHVPGVHFYDEPGLSWWKDPQTGKMVPHMLPAQVRAYVSSFDREPLRYNKVDPKNPKDVEAWMDWARWKESFMESAWKEAAFGVQYVRPDYLTLNQSQYAWFGFTDGYYFNIARALSVTSGHGGYDDGGLSYLQPLYYVVMARARDLDKGCWYLPCWYGGTPSNNFRMEQYNSFQQGIQGLISPPDCEPAINPGPRDGLVESNKIMGRLGTIFATGRRPVRTPLAILYSLTDLIHTQAQDTTATFGAWETPQGAGVMWGFVAAQMIQQPMQAVVDEDVLDGTLAANHKALMVMGMRYLDPKIIAALEKFVADGGVVLTSDCTVKINGAIDLGVKAADPNAARMKQIGEEYKTASKDPAKMQALSKETDSLRNIGQLSKGAKPLADAIKAQLDKAGIKPAIETDQPLLIASRQGGGDIEYVFTVNDTSDGKTWNQAIAVDANVKLPTGGRNVYDAVVGGPARDLKDGAGKVRFGAGQMKAWAMTRAPIGGVKAGAATVSRDFTAKADPIKVDFSAVLTDDKGGLLAGDAPMQITVVDALGQTRYDLYRAAKGGVLNISLPLAINDPAGTWKVIVKDLLGNTTDQRTFTYETAKTCSGAAGATHRAVYFQDDWNNIFRFARVHRDATVVYGKSDYDKAAAERIAKVLEPWDVKCKLVAAQDVNKPRPLTPEQTKTWVGVDFGRVTPAEGGTGKVGFDITGHVILVGTPEDNPLIAQVARFEALPYKASADFPGKGKGYISWQRDMIGQGQESVTLIAYDAAGMSEAVGTMYEAVHGLDPLTKYAPADASTVVAASKATQAPAMKIAWEAMLPDRVESLAGAGQGVTFLCADGSTGTLTADGKIASIAVATEAKAAPAIKPDEKAMKIAAKCKTIDRMLRNAVTFGDLTAVAYWGGTLKLVDAEGNVKFQMQMPDDIGGLAVDGDKLIVGTSSGKVYGLTK